MHPERPTTGARGALLDEYARAIAELKRVISDVDDASMNFVLHPEDPDPNCRSIASVLEHVVRAGHRYPTFIRQKRSSDPSITPPVRKGPTTAAAFCAALDEVFQHTVAVLATVPEEEMMLRELDQLVVAPWGQRFDFDQLMEHAIVHILRHRRQIERFMRELAAR